MTLLTLNLREWKALETVAARTTDAHILRRAQALLWLDEGETVPEVAAQLRVTRQAVYKWVTCDHGGDRAGPARVGLSLDRVDDPTAAPISAGDSPSRGFPA